jgi:hypothetical protein
VRIGNGPRAAFSLAKKSAIGSSDIVAVAVVVVAVKYNISRLSMDSSSSSDVGEGRGVYRSYIGIIDAWQWKSGGCPPFLSSLPSR